MLDSVEMVMKHTFSVLDIRIRTPRHKPIHLSNIQRHCNEYCEWQNQTPELWLARDAILTYFGPAHTECTKAGDIFTAHHHSVVPQHTHTP